MQVNCRKIVLLLMNLDVLLAFDGRRSSVGGIVSRQASYVSGVMDQFRFRGKRFASSPERAD